MIKALSIVSIGSISPLGISLEEARQSYLTGKHVLREEKFDTGKEWVASLPSHAKEQIGLLKSTHAKYQDLDESVLYAIYASRKAVEQAGWKLDTTFGINMGSSRGATSLFERYHREFITTKKTSTLSSPTTTLGNISSWVGHDLQTKGPDISHSITCSTALHALLNGMAWIKSGMADKF